MELRSYITHAFQLNVYIIINFICHTHTHIYALWHIYIILSRWLKSAFRRPALNLVTSKKYNWLKGTRLSLHNNYDCAWRRDYNALDVLFELCHVIISMSIERVKFQTSDNHCHYIFWRLVSAILIIDS